MVRARRGCEVSFESSASALEPHVKLTTCESSSFYAEVQGLTVFLWPLRLCEELRVAEALCVPLAVCGHLFDFSLVSVSNVRVVKFVTCVLFMSMSLGSARMKWEVDSFASEESRRA